MELPREILSPDSLKAIIPEWAEEAVCFSTACAGESLRGMSGACQRADCGAVLLCVLTHDSQPTNPGRGLAAAESGVPGLSLTKVVRLHYSTPVLVPGGV